MNFFLILTVFFNFGSILVQNVNRFIGIFFWIFVPKVIPEAVKVVKREE